MPYSLNAADKPCTILLGTFDFIGMAIAYREKQSITVSMYLYPSLYSANFLHINKVHVLDIIDINRYHFSSFEPFPCRFVLCVRVLRLQKLLQLTPSQARNLLFGFLEQPVDSAQTARFGRQQVQSLQDLANLLFLNCSNYLRS